MVQVRDSYGNVVGYFAKSVTIDDSHTTNRLAQSTYGPPDPADVQRAAASNPRTYTTEEVLTHLRSLGNG